MLRPEQQSLPAYVSNLIAPLTIQQFYHLLVENGFSRQGYSHFPQNSSGSDPLGFILHFASEGVLKRLYFQPVPVNRDFLTILHDLYHSPLQNTQYKTALVANFACSFLNHSLFQDQEVRGGTPREAADRFSNPDIDAMLTCQLFGALPYFVIGDSHSRLYQHHGLLCSSGWLLPISITCSGGSARGLANNNSRLKYGERLRQFYQRIHPAIAQGFKCFFKFGQVDLEYLFNFRWAQEGGRQFNEDKFIAYGDESIHRYIGYLSGLIPADVRKHIHVCSVSLPALADHACKKTYLEGIFAFTPQSQDEIAKLRPAFDNLEIPDIKTRSRLHLEFNQRLQNKAERAGFSFSNDAILFLDDNTGMAKDIFTRKSAGQDVHIDRTEPALALMSGFIESALKPLVNS